MRGDLGCYIEEILSASWVKVRMKQEQCSYVIDSVLSKGMLDPWLTVIRRGSVALRHRIEGRKEVGNEILMR